MSPVLVHVVRPYESEEEYLSAEAWTIDARGMLLVGESEVATDTAVVFDVALANGSKVIRAEGRASGYLAPTEERPGGLRVRFRRFGAQTKAFIDRALQARQAQLANTVSSLPPPPPDPQLSAQPLSTIVASVVTPAAAAPAALERSGVHRRLAAVVAAPPNRDELLERLRERTLRSSPNAGEGAAERSKKSS